MTAVTQKIPNLIGGISQQPDELKPEGSLREALNVIPDVTEGLKKRGASRLINPLTTNELGTWFCFNYSAEEKYIGKIATDGEVSLFSCATGLPVIMQYSEYDPSKETDPAYNPSIGYPDCEIDLYNATRLNWLEQKSIYDEKNATYNRRLNKYNDFVAEDYETKYKVEEIYEDYILTEYAAHEGRADRGFTSAVGQRIIGYELIEGFAKVPGPNITTDDSPGPDWEWERGDRELENVTVFYDGEQYNNADVYKSVYTLDLSAEKDQLKEEADNAYETAKRAEGIMDEAYEQFAVEAAKCGLSDDSQTVLRSLIESDVVPTYLRHEKQNQLRTLVVGNRIFIINPEIETSMNSTGFPERRRENFIEVNVAAGMQDYSLELVAEDTDVTPYTEVREVEVIDGAFTDEDGACPLQGYKEETFNDGDKMNLTIELTITGAQVLEGDGTDIEDYNCKYRSDARIINPGVGWQVDDIVEMTIEDRLYKIKITETEELYTAEGAPVTVPTTPNGVDKPVKVTTILSDIKSAIQDQDEKFTCEIIGNGVWVTHTDPEYVWRFSAPNKALMNVTTDEVNAVTQLPTQCRSGYTVKVTNTETADDDYYAAFKTEEEGIDGPGVWIETVAPLIDRYINPGSMPHQIVRQSDGSFVCGPVEWEPRQVGDENTNPKPGFMSRPDEDDIRTIENMVFFRNRLCILSGDTITCSRAGDYYNFFYSSALTIADNDPVDIACGSTSSSASARLTDAIEIGQGLVCFTGGEQFVLSSSSEAFTPNTARFNRIGTYSHSAYRTVTRIEDNESFSEINGVPVFSLGTSVGFLSDSGVNTRLMEMFNIGQSAEASVNELSKPVSKLVPFGINLLADSRDNNLIALGNKGSKDVWLYRYFNNDQRRVQSAWFKWTLPARLAYHTIMDDVYYSVSYSRSDSNNQPITSLQSIDLKSELITASVYDKYVKSEQAGVGDIRADNGEPFNAHMDNYRIAQPSEMTYYDHLDQTYFRAPLIYYKDLVDEGKLQAYMLSPTPLQASSPYVIGEEYFTSIGSMVPVRVEVDYAGTWFVMDGNWTSTRMMIGYVFDMEVQLPTLYPAKTTQTSTGAITQRDVRSYLNLHRVKINFGQIGVFDTTLRVRGRNDYVEQYECKTMDEYPADEIAFDEVKTQVMPVYAKNTDTSIVINSAHPSPCTIFSLEWEGDFASKWYRSV